MKKILFSFVILFCFITVTTQVFAMPTSESQLVINDEYIYMNGIFYGDIIPGVSYDETTNELTLNSANITDIFGYKLGNEFKINVKGENNVEYIEIQETDAVVDGDGSLVMDTKTNTSCINIFDGNITIKNIELVFENEEEAKYFYAVYAQDNRVSIENATITFKNIPNLILSKDVEISNSSINGTDVTYMIETDDVTIIDTKIEVNNVVDSLIIAKDKIAISETYIYADGQIEYAFLESGSDITIENSDVTLDNSNELASPAIIFEGTLSIEDSEISIETITDGIYGEKLAIANSNIEIDCGDIGIKVANVTIQASDISIRCESNMSCGIICDKFETNESNIDISNVYFGILGYDELKFNSGEILIDSNLAAAAVTKQENTPGIILGEGMITYPHVPIISTYYKEHNSYAIAFATGDIVVDEEAMTIENIVEDIVIKEGNVYEVIEGKNQTFIKYKDDALTFEIDGPYDKFSKVYINYKEIDKDNYTSEEGSTIVTVAQGYLNSLDRSTYNITFEYTDGYAETNFYVKEATKDNTPGTGTQKYIPCAMSISIIALAGIVVFTKKQEN